MKAILSKCLEERSQCNELPVGTDPLLPFAVFLSQNFGLKQSPPGVTTKIRLAHGILMRGIQFRNMHVQVMGGNHFCLRLEVIVCNNIQNNTGKPKREYMVGGVAVRVRGRLRMS